MRPIDADAFIEELEADAEHIESSIARMMHYAIIKDIEHAPTIDAVSVVRCGECKHSEVIGKGLLRYCNKSVIPMIRDKDDYCSWGERGEQND